MYITDQQRRDVLAILDKMQDTLRRIQNDLGEASQVIKEEANMSERHEGRWYAIYSPPRDAWRDADGNYGPLSRAELFRQPFDEKYLESDERWVGPMSDAEIEEAA